MKITMNPRTLSRRHASNLALVIAAACNLFALVADVARGAMGAAGLQSLNLVLLAVVAYVLERATTLLDLKIAAWTAQRDTAEMMHADLLRQKAAFDASQASATQAARARAH